MSDSWYLKISKFSLEDLTEEMDRIVHSDIGLNNPNTYFDAVEELWANIKDKIRKEIVKCE